MGAPAGPLTTQSARGSGSGEPGQDVGARGGFLQEQGGTLHGLGWQDAQRMAGCQEQVVRLSVPQHPGLCDPDPVSAPGPWAV